MSALFFAAACSDGGPTDPGGNGTGDRLPGDGNALAATAIPDRRFEARAGDYTTSHPELPGLYASFNTLMLATTPTATVGTVNALLDEIDAAIVGGVRGVAQQSGGILFLRLPVTTHADMEAALGVLRASPAVAAASQDVLVQGDLLPRAGAPQQEWTWELVANGGNWGLELARMPQAWNLNAAIVKARGPAFSVPIGIIDEGFASSHVDVVFAQAPTGPAEDHGTFVAGIIGANFDNSVGINGVTPFAALVPRSAAPNTNPGDPILERLRSVGQLIIDQFGVLVRAQPQMPVVNMSVGYNWVTLQPAGGPLEPGVIPSQSAKARQLADDQGAIFKVVLETLQAENGRLPLVVVSAGNNSGGLIGEQQARYNSPMANAAIRLGARNVVVAEGVMQLLGSAAPLRFVASDHGGHLSAAAFAVRSTIRGDNYANYDGTSFAAPQIAGLAGYLYALDPALPWPTLTQNPVLDLLVATARPVTDVAPHIDAFAAALQVDVLQQNDRVLRLLLDVDDGSVDGNLRVDLENGTEITDDDEDGDGGSGDGAIDMSDFRRWRDWLLQAEAAGTLNGSGNHPKKDLNGDGRVQDAAAENLYPRGDFNGDGLISRVADREMSGVLGGQTLTDLEVLQAVFEDTDYQASELNGLIDSGDAHVDASMCLARPEVAGVRSWVEVTGSGVLAESRSHEAPLRVYTLAETALGWTLHMEGLDASGEVVGEAEQEIDVTPGSDHYWKPDCVPCAAPSRTASQPSGAVEECSQTSVDIEPDSTGVTAGGTVQFTATVTGATNQQVTWTTTQPGGTISGTGLFTASATTGTFRVIASSVEDPSARDSAQVTVTGAAPVTGIWNTFVAVANGYFIDPTDCCVAKDDRDEKYRLEDGTFTPITATLSGSRSGSWPDRPETTDVDESGSASGNGTANGSLSFDRDASGRIRSIDFSASASASASSSNASDGGGGSGSGFGQTQSNTRFSVGGMSPVTVTIQGSCSFQSTVEGSGWAHLLLFNLAGGGYLVNLRCTANGAIDYTVVLAPGNYEIGAGAYVSVGADHPTVTSASGSAGITLVVRFVP